MTPQEKINYLNHIKILVQIGIDQTGHNPDKTDEMRESGYICIKALDKEINEM